MNDTARKPALADRRGTFGPVVVLILAVSLALGVAAIISVPSRDADAASIVPPGFRDEAVIDGLSGPTSVRFSQDGRVFVAEKSGIVKVFDGLDDATPTTFADLRTNVHDFWDRGLLGLALDPQFPTRPYVYVLYTYNALPGGTAPRWPDACPTPPGATGDGCVVGGRLSRLQAAGNVMTGTEQVLIQDWCQQYPSHSVGDLAFGADGRLYVSGGDGASFNFVDYGQAGGSSGSPTPRNPCGDPPTGIGGIQTPPTAEGGALRSQDSRTTADPTSLDGAVLRVDPDTGQAVPGNPRYGDGDANAARIVAYGLRNPFRFTVRPGTNEVWLGDVGWSTYEEINRLANPTDGATDNFGWPCYEGAGRQGGYDGANLNICENLYNAAGAVTPPYYSYSHSERVVAGETCPSGGSSTAGMAFYGGGPYPDAYDGALFFADYSRRCIWAMKKGANGLPNPADRETFVAGASSPVGLQIGPDGDLFYANLDGGEIRRIRHSSGNQPPVANASANPSNGDVPLDVTFDASGSSDPDAGDTLTYAWDLDNDGAYDDSTALRPTRTYTAPGSYTVGLRVTDGFGQSDTDSVTVSAGNTAPTVTIGSPPSATTWKVGDEISFSGSATDPQDGTLSPSRLSWTLTMRHCSRVDPTSCHSHDIQDFEGVASGSFVAPDHEYPSHLELGVTAVDSGGLRDTETVRLNPQTVELTLRSQPAGLQLVLGNESAAATFSRTVIVGSTNSISAPTPQTLSGTGYSFGSWSDGGGASHNVVAGAQPQTLTATYATGVPTSLGDLSANPKSLTYGGTTTLSGKLVSSEGGPSTSGKNVLLDSRPSGSSEPFRPVAVAPAVTGADGSFSFQNVRPEKNTAYRARFAADSAAGLLGSVSSPVRVTVRVAVTLDPTPASVPVGTPVTISGSVAPNHSGGSVRLTIRRSGTVVETPSVTLDGESRFSYTYVPATSGSYRVTANYAGDGDHAGGTSVARSFRAV